MLSRIRRNPAFRACSRWLLAGALIVGLHSAVVLAGHLGFRGGAVGGISVDAEGVVGNVNVDARRMLRQALLKEVKPAGVEMNAPVELRKVSLKGIEAALADAQQNNLGQIPDEVKYLAGLQRIQYIVLVPEENDILLVGPAEGWKIDDNANVVGVTTGRPVLLLEDLAMAFRTVNAAREGGISCSIDPTAEGLQNLQRFLRTRPQMGPGTLNGIQQALGMHDIKVAGVPADSHFARVLVAADYHMKRYAMNLDPAPVKGMDGFLDLVRKQNAKVDNMMPRWWLACNYEPIGRSEDRLTWELRGPGVKALTEDEVTNPDGTITQTGKKSAVAQKWADIMTERYDELSGRNVVFGELRNLMDLCVVAALIQKEGLFEKAGCSLPRLTSPNNALTNYKWPTPRRVATQCSFINRNREYVITASGGVQIDSFGVADRVQVDDTIKAIRERSLARNSNHSWWWN
ncbi:MAG: DUF1598 domain-containing protein [Pirellulales bacterium]